MNKLMESRQKKIEALEATLKEIKEENCGLKQKIEVQKLKGDGGNSKVSEVQLATVVKERDQLRAALAELNVEAVSASEEVNPSDTLSAYIFNSWIAWGHRHTFF